jgi:acyl transferase domain-containing protein
LESAVVSRTVHHTQKPFGSYFRRGVDAITEVPAERWDARRFYDPDPDKPGKTYVKQGGFLHERIDYFDPLTFGMSPREAHTLDPQQRLLLEVTWEAIEDAGLLLENLAGSRTGVFMGSFALDMKMLQSSPLNRDVLYSYSTTGASMTLLANRLSYVFDWHGPSIAIDTACSSSLVATHYACQSIWRGECDLAVAGGANVMLRPEYFMVMCKGHYLSPQGRCRAFDARGDGYVRGEGAGVVLLKPLSAALRDRDPIYALIRATGVNQDGQTAGISLPNQDAQERLITEVYQQAGILPGEVQYIEAHGTGTKAGDPVEARALHRALSAGRAPRSRNRGPDQSRALFAAQTDSAQSAF